MVGPYFRRVNPHVYPCRKQCQKKASGVSSFARDHQKFSICHMFLGPPASTIASRRTRFSEHYETIALTNHLSHAATGKLLRKHEKVSERSSPARSRTAASPRQPHDFKGRRKRVSKKKHRRFEKLWQYLQLPAMQERMTCGAQRDQVLLGIIAALATELRVVNFQIRSGPTTLAPPTIAPQHLLPKLFV